MGEPTVNRVTLRREICQDLGMPFFRRWPNGLVVQDTATSGMANATDSAKLVDSRFNQRRKYWKSAWLYDVTSGEQRKVVDFIRDQKALIPEYDFTTVPSTATTFEIMSIHTPAEIHTAIDDAIAEGFPIFFDIVTDETLIVEEDKREYELSVNNSDGRGILSNPYRIKSIYIERTASGGVFVIDTASTTTSIVNAAAGFSASGLDSGWSLAVYSGTGSGQYILPTGPASANAIPVAAPTVALDTSSQIRFWNRSVEVHAWDPVTAIEFDAKDYPNKMRMLFNTSASRGMRFRIQYVGEPQPLLTDTAAGTTVPKRYIKARALATLLRQRARRLPGEADKYALLAQAEQADADRFKLEHSFDMPDQTTWTEEHYGRNENDYFERNNPLDY